MQTLMLTTHEYETIYRILITSSVESVGEQRNLNDVLELFEGAGHALDSASANGVPRMYTVATETRLELTGGATKTLREHIGKGIGRFQTWSVRCLPGVLDRLEAKEA